MNTRNRIPDGQASIDVEEEAGLSDVDPAVLRIIRTTVQAMHDRSPPEVNYGRRQPLHGAAPWKFWVACFGSAILGAACSIVSNYWSVTTDVAAMKEQVKSIKEEVDHIYRIVEPRFRGTALHADNEPQP